MDMLAPEGYGEVIGSGQREDSEDILLRKIAEHGLNQEHFEWYLDLRRYGSVPHGGFRSRARATGLLDLWNSSHPRDGSISAHDGQGFARDA